MVRGLSLAGAATSIAFVVLKTRVCHDKHMFVTTKHVLCRDKSMFVLLSRQNYVCRDKHVFVATKMILA